MIEEQTMKGISPESLVAEARAMRDQGFRLVQIGATRLGEEIELNYSFDLAHRLVNLRFRLPKAGVRVPSISGIYWSAFAYENEISDLFGVQVEGNVLYFKGTFYQTAVKHPFIQDSAPAAAKPPVQP